MNDFDVTIAGAGLAGSEAAWQLINRGFKVRIIEMRPEKMTPAHNSAGFAELVCSNSLKSIALNTGSGLLKAELERYGSMLIPSAYKSQVPAGGALAVDRAVFSEIVTETLSKNPSVQIEYAELTSIPSDIPLIIATGPLTSDTLASEIKQMFGGALYFADAISPIIDASSIDISKGYFLGRYGKGGSDYLNLPLTESEYDEFYDALISAECQAFHGFETPDFFEGCMPVEEMASRGRQTLTFGPMKPVGLENPETGARPFAVMQLRKENIEGTAYNIVGFQTKMTVPSQKRVFSMIPALKSAEFLRYGSVHRNTYINSPKFLNNKFQMRDKPNIFFAGQITGVEGYNESIASGLIAGVQMAAYLRGEKYEFPKGTAMGSLSAFISGESGLAHATEDDYIPSNFHFGMLPPLEKRVRGKSLKKEEQARIALEITDKFLNTGK